MAEREYDYTRGLREQSVEELTRIESGNIDVFARIVANSVDGLIGTKEGRAQIALEAHMQTKIDVERAKILIERLTLEIQKRAAKIKPETVQAVAEAVA